MNGTSLAKAFSEARTQLVQYEKALRNQLGEKFKLQSYIVVAVGFKRLLGKRQQQEADMCS